MALLPENFKAFQFQSGLEIIRGAFQASIATTTGASAKAEQARLDYSVSGQDDSEYEDGFLVRSTAHDLGYASLQASIAVRLVREAFVTTAFHYWEKSARGWTGLHGKHENFPILSRAVSEQYALHTRLKDLNTLNNLLKHNSDDTADELFKVWPEVFRPPVQSSIPEMKPILTLMISNDHVEQAFDAVAASGPQLETA